MDKLLNIIALILSLLTVSVGVWNAYQNQLMGRVIAELQLNLRREFNGRYVTLDRFNDLKDRVSHVEEDEHQH